MRIESRSSTESFNSYHFKLFNLLFGQEKELNLTKLSLSKAK